MEDKHDSKCSNHHHRGNYKSFGRFCCVLGTWPFRNFSCCNSGLGFGLPVTEGLTSKAIRRSLQTRRRGNFQVSEYAEWTAIGGILAVAVAVSLSFGLSTYALGSSASTITVTSTSATVSPTPSNATAPLNSSAHQAIPPYCNLLAGSVSKDGFQLDIYLESRSANVGGNIVICTDFQNISNETSTTYASDSYVTITNSSGSIVAQPGCGQNNGNQTPTGFSCSVSWFTILPDTSTLAPGIAAGTYALTVAVPLSPTSQIEYDTTLTLTN